METLNTAKVLCDEFSNMTFSEKTEIIISDERIQEYIDGVLDSNRFYSKMPAFLSLMYALGGGVIKCYAVDGAPVIDYLPADCFVPVEYSNRGITAGVFRSVSFVRNRYYSLFEYYNGGRVEYKLFRSFTRGQLGEECPLSELYEGLPSCCGLRVRRPDVRVLLPGGLQQPCDRLTVRAVGVCQLGEHSQSA